MNTNKRERRSTPTSPPTTPAMIAVFSVDTTGSVVHTVSGPSESKRRDRTIHYNCDYNVLPITVSL